MIRRRIHVDNIPEPIRQALINDFNRTRKKQVSINDIVATILAKRYGLEVIHGKGAARGTDCDPLILKVREDMHTEIKKHSASSDASMRALVIDALARHYRLTEHSVPLVRERTYAA